jgi:hypothetical protein
MKSGPSLATVITQIVNIFKNEIVGSTLYHRCCVSKKKVTVLNSLSIEDGGTKVSQEPREHNE